MIFDREGDFNTDVESPLLIEQKGMRQDILSISKLTHRVFIEDMDKDVMSPFLHNMSRVNFRVSVSNFKNGIITPLTDYMNNENREDRGTETSRHKETILYLASVRRTIEQSNAANSKKTTDSIRETYYGLTKSVVSALGTVITPILKGAGFLLFGTGKEKKSVVQAIEEQTQFLRTGRIFDNSTLFGRFMRRGIVGSAVAGVAGVAGVGRGTAQRAEIKRSEGAELTTREKLVTRMSILTGVFSDIEKRDVKATFQPNSPEARQESLLDRIRLGVESFMEFFRDYSGKMYTEIQLVNKYLDAYLKNGGDPEQNKASQIQAANDEEIQERQTYKIVDALREASNSSITAMASGYDVVANTIVDNENRNARQDRRLQTFQNFQSSQILKNISEGIERSNSPVMTPYEQRMLETSNAQYEELQIANEMAIEAANKRKEQKDEGMGIIGIIGALFTSKAALAVKAAAAKYVISPVIGAIKAGGAWLMKNGFKLLLRAPFAKIFAIGLVSKLLYDHLLRPMVGWFDDTFGTEIGAKLDSFTGWFSDKFTNMFDWIREKISNVPVIGRLFKSDEDKIPKVPESDKVVEDSSSGVVGWMSDQWKNAIGSLKVPSSEVKETSSGVLSWMNDQWKNAIGKFTQNDGDISESNGTGILKWLTSQWQTLFESAKESGIVQRSFTGVTGLASGVLDVSSEAISELASVTGKAVERGIDKIRGYDYDAFTDIRRQNLDPASLAGQSLAQTMNPLMRPSFNTVTDSMTMAAATSKREAFAQVEEMKRRHAEQIEINQRMLQSLQSVVSATEATAGAAVLNVKVTAEEQRKRDSLSITKDY